MQLDDTKLTSVRVIPDLYSKFKVEGSKYKIDFHALSERAMFLYLNDEEFKKKINNTTNVK